MEETLITLDTAQKLGMTEDEFNRVQKILGRMPNFTELSIFAVMWSEHCSYKNSIAWLKTLPKDGPQMLARAGEENAGLVDIGDGLGCSFKIESHNHPCAIEPYQGAATGVGGINRDIFTMGARPVAQLNSLRFGNPEDARTQWHMKGVVKGIGDYGNAFGIPTVGGEVFFDQCYNVNPLVNAFSAGIVDTRYTAKATSYGAGNPVFIVGSATGKDGIHGATFASEDITDASSDNLPAVQVGDPFQEKLLLEASLEIIKTGHVIGIQDMGAAGIICSTSEMSAKGEHGMRINLEQVPMRQEGMQPFEILLSESQERMLVVIKKGYEKAITDIFDKWDLNCACIGEVTESKRLEFFMHGDKVADVPAWDLVLGGGAPVYERPYEEPAYYRQYQQFDINSIPEPGNLKEAAIHLLQHPNNASRAWVARQYDSMVGIANMSTNAPSDASLIRLKNSNKALAIKVDCNSRYVNADPEEGTAIAVAEAARNIVCSGGEPEAITNCLNFGNPYKPEVYWQFVGAIKGMKKACEKFNTPVTGGNVSFYNQSPDGGPVFPTPVIGMLGLLKDKKQQMTLDFKASGDKIYLLGTSKNCIASSQYLYSYHNQKAAPAPSFDLQEEHQLQETLQKLIPEQLIRSAHDVANGGLWLCLVESALPRQLGFSVNSNAAGNIRKDAWLFGESQSRVIVSVAPDQETAFREWMDAQPVAYTLLGSITDASLEVDGEVFMDIHEAASDYEQTLPTLLDPQS